MTAGPLAAGGDLHYHLSQHGVFSEAEMRFYAAEIILGLEHMHSRFVVYRDLKVTVPMGTHGPRRHQEAPLMSPGPVETPDPAAALGPHGQPQVPWTLPTQQEAPGHRGHP